MKRLALILLAFLTLPAPAFEVDGRTVTFTDADIQACQEGGGCVFVSRKALLDMIEKSRSAASSCSDRA